uniref:Uncharacterized protein n=1 Tax=Meloidogyne enterolobii TaxID=390850 RepID=A0A6V7V8J3_MELEN|nr:unnamed protein product [Meloidogyne enterolobii]
MRGSQYDSLWNRLESEIHLNRHKTFVKTCYVPDVKDFLRQQNDLKHQKPTTSKNKNSSLHSKKKCLPIFTLLSPCSPSSSNNSETSTCNSLCEQHFERINWSGKSDIHILKKIILLLADKQLRTFRHPLES